MPFKIVTDTSANLPTAYLNENSIAVLPFSYIVKGTEHQCLDTEAFEKEADFYYSKVLNSTPVSTSQVTPQAFKDCFEQIVQNGDDVLYIGMSSGISGAYNSSEMAAEEIREAYPGRKVITIDTRAASLGEGLAVMLAVEKKNEGFGLEETAELVREKCRNMAQIFVVDGLMHLRRTGRLTGAAAVIGVVLNIKPILKGNVLGQIVNTAKVKGRKQALIHMSRKYQEYVVNAKDQTVGIAYTTGREDALYLASLLNEIDKPKRILLVRYEPVTGAHVGEGTIALFFDSTPEFREKA